MATIHKLSDELANKIAAGEVVERPASIVKELVENALDANSRHILVEVEEGGMSKIRVLDDGDGIEASEVETAFFRHATSKIKTDKDLFNILTLGFRGEALPSIASVACVELKTSTGEGAGTSIRIEGGKIVEKSFAKTRRGTEVIVSQLFYNTPARLKYLKTVHTELGNISDVMNRMALAHPDVAFELLHHDKQLLKTSGNGDFLQVIASVYGRQIAKEMLYIEGESLDFTVRGYIAKPEVTRASRQYMSTFINGRYIRNFPLARAIADGYHTLLPIGRHPIAMLYIEMDPTLIDVNVHPSKLEVRLSKEDELTGLVKRLIQDAFKKETLIPSIVKNKSTPQVSEQTSFNFSAVEEAVTTNEHKRLYGEEDFAHIFTPKNEPLLVTEEAEDEVEEPLVEEESVHLVETPVQQLIQPEKPSRVPVMYPIGQMHGTYILAQNETGLYIVDQHAAQERILYEYYREKVGKVSTELQDLLIPLTFEFTQSELQTITEYREELEKVGIFLEPFGGQTFIVRAHPTWLPKGEEQATIRELIDQVLTMKKVDIKKLREEAAILMSCKAAIKANRHLRQDEIFALLESLRKSSDPFTCPHGRPIIIHMTTYEMEKLFKRVM
ncbi:MAG TPA: DNA mismatch repair endonuclease MutL [Bacilli bacterium]|nr:DNA mismatch repair endonuclease MutL [Bacilli bacterium]